MGQNIPATNPFPLSPIPRIFSDSELDSNSFILVGASGGVSSDTDRRQINDTRLVGFGYQQFLDSINAAVTTPILSNYLALINDTSLQIPGKFAFVRDSSDNPDIARPVWSLYIFDSDWILVATEEDVILSSDVDDAVEVPFTIGGLDAGTPAGDLKGLTMSKLWNIVLFPTVDPFINPQNSVALSLNPNTSPVEVGTILRPVLTANYNQGRIINGDGSTGPLLTGVASSFDFTGPGLTGTVNIPSGGTNIGDTQAPVGVNALDGNNTWNVSANFTDGTGSYFDNKGNDLSGSFPAIDDERSNFTSASPTSSRSVSGRRAIFVGDVRANDSADVRALTQQQLLSTSRTISTLYVLPAGSTEFCVAVPSGKTLNVSDLTALGAPYVVDNNGGSTMILSQFNVEAANAFGAIQYDVWNIRSDFAGFSEDHEFEIILT